MSSNSSLINFFFYINKNKRLIIAALVLGLIATAFWTGSRYPALNEKAALGSDNTIAGIAFDQVIPVSATDSVIQRITANSLNWAYTNKQGMSFGLLFAASIITLLQLFRRKHFESRLANTLLGVSMGAPLGVCVNCAVPIAMGAQSAGTRTETTLAMMFSSPTLNIIVLTMAIALFPPWLVALKIGATLLFIILAVPLSVRWFGSVQRPNAAALSDIEASAGLPSELQTSSTDMPGIAIHGTWLSALIWVSREMLRNLWFIVRITLPFMALAGILGATAVTLLPWEMLAGALPESEFARFALLVGIALLGTFLPVPIAFDIVICSILLAAGVEARYVATLLVTLGIFSIYPALQIGRTISTQLSIGLFLMVTVLGVIVGLAADSLAAWEAERQNQALEQGLLAAPQGHKNRLQVTPALSSDKALQQLTRHQVFPGEKIMPEYSALEIQATPLRSSDGIGEHLFTTVYGDSIGIDEPDNISPLRFVIPLATNRSIASGDVHGDGWPDLLLTSEAGLALYANLGGVKFLRQEIRVPELKDAYFIRAALVDLDGDADLDIVAGTFQHGVYFIPNNKGNFESGATQLPGYHKGAVPGVLAFGDIDRDGDLDAVVGNRAIGNSSAERTVSAAQNYFLIREGDSWQSQALPGPEGETLSILLSDLNSDGWLDVFVGNDFAPPDHLLLSDGEGSLKPVEREKVIGGSTRFTMSIASADVNGDLIPEIYIGSISGRGNAEQRNADEECSFETGAEKIACIERLIKLKPFIAARFRGDVLACEAVNDMALKEGCMLIAMTTAIMSRGGTGVDAVGDLCERIPVQWESFRVLCEARRAESVEPMSNQEIQQTLSSSKKTNTLLVRDAEEIRFTDQATNMGIEDSGWAWNSRFADINLDSHQDLYVVNGYTIARTRYDHHLFLNNGNGFYDAAVETGIASRQATASYTYFDFDRDGDLDIVTVPMIGPARLFVNNAAGRGNHAIELELRDESKNAYAIGAVVTIHYGPDGSLAQMRELQLSGGFASYDEPIVHFGLGEYEQIKSLTIRWPDGDTTSITQDFSSGTRYRIQRLSQSQK